MSTRNNNRAGKKCVRTQESCRKIDFHVNCLDDVNSLEANYLH